MLLWSYLEGSGVCRFLVPRPAAVALCSAALMYYLWARRCQTPILVCSDTFKAFLRKHCPAVAHRFSPTPWCWGGRLQTLLPLLIKSKPQVTYRNEVLRTADGGRISLDWVDNVSSAAYPASATRPTVLILPGLTGNSQQLYVYHVVSQATRRGYRCVVFTNRGFDGEELLTPYTFCVANTADLDHVILHVKALLPQAPLLGVGVSMGGMLVLNYLADKGPRSGLVAAITLSVCWNTQKSAESVEQPINWLLFNRQLAANLCRAISRNRKVLDKVVDIDHVMKAQTIREFDERFTSVVNGYKSCADYYIDANPDVRLPRTTTPVLCLNAADDPLCPENTCLNLIDSLPSPTPTPPPPPLKGLPMAMVQHLANVALLVTAHGGHLGFLEGLLPLGECYMDRLVGQFIQAGFEHTEELRQACGVKEEVGA
ncbi:Protein ABHD1 [Merluccius polli]|uniref:Phospholipase ABHD3 n=1 Tax=Merluccius polli TaxID=89951 RepID=A0AA47N3Y5_MERPO|nr:Protein ABHD1 [Merluccius polli]